MQDLENKYANLGRNMGYGLRVKRLRSLRALSFSSLARCRLKGDWSVILDKASILLPPIARFSNCAIIVWRYF